MDRRKFIAGAVGGSALVALGAATRFPGSVLSADVTDSDTVTSSAHVKNVTAITQVFGDGQKLTAVALEYDRDIRNSGLSTSTFTVADRTITNVYASTRPRLAERGRDGRFVIVEMSADDTAAALWVEIGGNSGPSPSASLTSSASPSSSASSSPPGNSGPTVGDNTPGGEILSAKASVTQTGPVYTVEGTRYAADSTVLATSKVINLIVDEFRQYAYTDSATGDTLGYNLFIPRNYDPRKRYPLVLFMHDASVVNVATIGPLVQGLGAVCWASPEDQARHECFVVAPEYPAVVIDNNYEPSSYFDTTINLVNSLTRQYSIDTRRLYNTGQSMGAMLSLGMDIKYPGMFAASFIVAGQWLPSQVAPLASEKLWIVVSQDDDYAYPTENEMMAVVEKEGTPVKTAVWNGSSTPAQFAADVRNMEDAGDPVNYAAFASGTLPTSGSGGDSAHMDTWHTAYTIPGIRDWIMRKAI